jgi:hypothetical protein
MIFSLAPWSFGFLYSAIHGMPSLVTLVLTVKRLFNKLANLYDAASNGSGSVAADKITETSFPVASTGHIAALERSIDKEFQLLVTTDSAKTAVSQDKRREHRRVQQQKKRQRRRAM